MPSVKIAIDIRRMAEFGVGTYIRNIVRTLYRLDQQNEYFLIGPPAKVQEIGVLPQNFQTISAVAPERTLGGYREFRSALTRLNCDLVHIPNLFSVPRFLPCPYVMTVHDMKNLGGVIFYDGGNVYSAINLHNFVDNYTNTVGFGLRYATPIGPVRVDVGRNLSPVPGLNPTQFFITIGQAF